jgi:hypothetical protein
MQLQVTAAGDQGRRKNLAGKEAGPTGIYTPIPPIYIHVLYLFIYRYLCFCKYPYLSTSVSKYTCLGVYICIYYILSNISFSLCEQWLRLRVGRSLMQWVSIHMYIATNWYPFLHIRTVSTTYVYIIYIVTSFSPYINSDYYIFMYY